MIRGLIHFIIINTLDDELLLLKSPITYLIDPDAL